MLRKVAIAGGVIVGAWGAWRVVQALRLGVSPVSALLHPTLPVQIAELADHPERRQTRSGAGHFA
jgi:hypothetical protein